MPIMDKAVQIVYDMSAYAKVRELAKWRDKSMLDMISSLDEAKTMGKAENLITNVKNLMTNTGKPLDEVLGMLGVTKEEYESSLELL